MRAVSASRLGASGPSNDGAIAATTGLPLIARRQAAVSSWLRSPVPMSVRPSAVTTSPSFARSTSPSAIAATTW